MKFKSQLITQGSGSIGGLTASHNRGGMYFRGRSMPTNPNTLQQQAVRNAVTQLSTRWGNELTEAQRQGWAEYAAQVTVRDILGDERLLTALQWYVACNSLRLQASVAIVDAAPTVYTMDTCSVCTPTATAPSGMSLAYNNADAWANEVGGYLLAWASRPTMPTVNAFKGPYRYMGKVAGAGTPPTSPATMTLPFVVAATQRVHIAYRSIRADGRISPPFRSYDDAA